MKDGSFKIGKEIRNRRFRDYEFCNYLELLFTFSQMNQEATGNLPLRTRNAIP